MKLWQRIEPTTVQNVGYRTIIGKHFRMNSGTEVRFDTIAPEGTNCVDIIALTKDNRVVVAKQFRPGPEILSYDTPGGMVEDGETIETAARRELLEETGYSCGQLEYIGPFYKDPNINATWHTFIAYDCEMTAEQSLDAEEEIEVELLTITDFIETAVSAKTVSSHIPILMTYDILMKLKETS